MTATTRWLTYSAVASRLGMTVQEVERLADRGLLERRLLGDHYSISERSVDACKRVIGPTSELPAACGEVLAEHVDRPRVGGGPEIGHEAELEYRRSKEDV